MKLGHILTIVNVVAILVAVPAFILLNYTLFPEKAGFWCNDVSIRYPYLKEKVNSLWLVLISLAFPIVFIGICELILNEVTRHMDSSTARPWKHLIIIIIDQTLILLFGWGLILGIVVVIKNLATELRPHFWAVCKPSVNCSLQDNVFVQNYTCTGTDTSLVKHVYRSFPSGHAASSAYSMAYLIFYMEKRLTHCLMFIKPILQSAFITAGLYVAFSRVQDHYHHSQDVFFGLILGCLMAWLMRFSKNPIALYKKLKEPNENGVEQNRATSALSLETTY